MQNVAVLRIGFVDVWTVFWCTLWFMFAGRVCAAVSSAESPVQWTVLRLIVDWIMQTAAELNATSCIPWSWSTSHAVDLLQCVWWCKI